MELGQMQRLMIQTADGARIKAGEVPAVVAPAVRDILRAAMVKQKVDCFVFTEPRALRKPRTPETKTNAKRKR